MASYMKGDAPADTRLPDWQANDEPDSAIVFEEKNIPAEGDVEALNASTSIQDNQNTRTNDITSAQSDLIDFDGPNDLENPQNWSRMRRWTITISGSLLAFTVTFSSSIHSVAIHPVAEEFNIGIITSTLGVSLFIVGFMFGPIVFGPMSEAYGRRIPLLLGFAIFTIFQIPVAVAQNVETIMLGRFFGGFAACSPLAIVGGMMADIWGPIDRAYAISAIASGGWAGPATGPVVGSYLTESLGWRWTSWITLILASFFGIIAIFVIPETSPPRILQHKAKKLRYVTKNWALHAKADKTPITTKTVYSVYLIRPFVMLGGEPILALMTAYMSFIYGVLYLFFEAYPVAFQEQRGWSVGSSSLPFLPSFVGIAFGAAGIAYSTETNFTRAFMKHGRPVPEERLPPMIVGAVILPVGLFWFGWTSSPDITWVPQVVSSAVLGGSTMVIFWQGLCYLIDCYAFYSNSAIAINTFIRSIFGAVFPLFARTMYQRLGVPWATSILGFVSAAFAPVPILFYIYGARIRKKSRWSPTGQPLVSHLSQSSTNPRRVV